MNPSAKNGPRQLFLPENGDRIYALTKGGLVGSVITKDNKVEKLTPNYCIHFFITYLRKQIYYDACCALDRGFYDSQFRKSDFVTLRDKYHPLAMAPSTAEDFHYIFNLMLG